MKRQHLPGFVFAVPCGVLVALYTGFLVSRWLHGGTATVATGPVVGGDFAFFWTASAALRGAGIGGVLDHEVLRSFAPVDAPAPWYRWVYPPTALLLFLPLASMPYVKALVACSLSGVVTYSGTVYAISRRPAVLLAALAFPGVFMTLLNGQLGLLLFTLFGMGLLLVPSRPLWAGALLGLMAFKPQHAWLVPVALVAGRHWMAFASATAALAGSMAISTAAFGLRGWEGAVRGATAASDLIQSGTVPHYLYVSAFGAARLAGLDARPAYVLQVGVAAVAAVAVARVWSGTAGHELKAAALAAASVFGNYYVLHYDLVLLGVALLFAARAAPWSRRSLAVLAAAWAAPLFAALLAQRTGVQVAPLVAGSVLLVLVRRAEAERRAAAIGLSGGVPRAAEDASPARDLVAAS